MSSPSAPAQRTPWVEHLLVIGGFTLLTVVMTWPTVLYLDQAIDAAGDVVLQLTTMTWDAHALVTDPLHIFDAPFFYPYYHSLAYSDHLIGQTLLTLPVFWLTNNPALALNAYKLFSFVATGYATYLLVRDSTGSRAGGLLAGVAFAFCGLRFMQLTHLHILATEWFPFTLWALRRGLHRQSGRWIGLAAVFFAMMALCSVYYTYFLALAVAGYLVWYFVFAAQNLKANIQNLKWLVLAGVPLALFVGVLDWPYLQVNGELGLARSTYEVANWSAVPKYFLRVLPSNWLWGTHSLLPASVLGERELFPGLILLLLAAVAILDFRFWLLDWIIRLRKMLGRSSALSERVNPKSKIQNLKSGERWYWLGLGLLALVLTFGLSVRLPNGADLPLPYALLYDWVPGFQALRVPVRFAILLDLALAVLAGTAIADFRFWILDFGLRRTTPGLQENPKSKIQNLKWAALWLLATGGILAESAQVLDLSNHRAVRPAAIQPYSWLADHGTGPVITFPFRGDSGDIWDAYWSTYNWRPLVNGWSGFVPPGTVYLSRALQAFPNRATVALLQGLEVQHVVVHLWQFPKAEQPGLQARLGATLGLNLVYQAGDDYVYELATNPWLRQLGSSLGRPGLVWFSAGVGATQPELEAPAYFARYRLGWGDRVHSDVPLGYKPLPSLPWGVPADAIIQPPGEPPPAGYNAAHSSAYAALYARDPALLTRYDLLADPARPCCAGLLPSTVGQARITVGAYTTTTVTLPFGAAGAAPTSVLVPPGVSTYLGLVGPEGISLNPATAPANGAQLLAVEGWARGSDAGPPGLTVQPATLLLNATTDAGTISSDMITAHIQIVPRYPQAGQLTLTLDIYQKPWGTHPDGHYGTFSVPAPVGADGETYDLTLHPAAQEATAQHNGAPQEVFAWRGPPREGDFAASLVLSFGTRLIEKLPLYDFTVRDGRLTAVDRHSARTVVAPLAAP